MRTPCANALCAFGAATVLALSFAARAEVSASKESDDLLDISCSDVRTNRCTTEPFVSAGRLLLDEDFFQLIGPTSDRNYTLGFGIDLSGRWVHQVGLDVPGRWLDRLAGVEAVRDRLARYGGAFGHSAGVHLAAFTPQDLASSAELHGDRPYASIIVAAARRIAVDGPRRFAIQSEFAVGVLGIPGAAKGIQTAIHTFGREHGWLHRENPQGWEHQISNGGEPTFRYAVTAWQTLSPEAWRHIDLAINGEGAVGWYTGIAAGLQLRVGRLASSPWSAPASPLMNVQQVQLTRADPAPEQQVTDDSNVLSQRPSLRDLQASPAPGGTHRGGGAWWEAYVFSSARTRVVAYNTLLHGQFRHSDVRIDLADISPVVEEIEFGATVRLAHFRVSYSILSLRTPEFRVPGGEPPRVHAWGGIYLGIE
jgi:hypothetical protein